MRASFASPRAFALSAFFLAMGICLASWISRTPSIRDGLNVSISEMGLVLFGLSVGSMTGILGAGPLIRRWDTRRVISCGLWLMVASMLVLSAGVAIQSPWFATLGFGLFGLGMGLGDIAMNLEGADVEAQTGKHLLHNLHGCFSLGTVVGAIAGISFNAIAFPIFQHLLIVAILSGVALVRLIGNVPPGFGNESETGGRGIEAPPVWKDAKLLLIGAFVLAMALAEGAANDWLPLIMVDEYGMDATVGSLIFLAFAVSMTIGRFSGGLILKHFGREAIMFASAVFGGIGLAIVIWSDSIVLAGAAVILWGLGASLGFPIALSAAGDSGPNAAARVKLVAVCGYFALLVGPPVLGFAGEEFGLRNALLIVLGLVLVAVLAAVLMTFDRTRSAAYRAKH